MSETRLCIHTKLNGKLCRGIALAGKPYCRFHSRHYERHCVTNPDYELPVFEDSRSVMIAIQELVRSRIQGKLDNRDLTAFMYAYQVAASTMNRTDAKAPDVEEDIELREAEKASARASRRNSVQKQEPEGPGLIEVLAEGLAEVTGEPIDFAADDHLPESERRSKYQIFFDDLKTRMAEDEPDTASTLPQATPGLS